MQRLLGERPGRDKPRCGLRRLSVETLPLEVRGEDIGTIAMGFKVTFPCLEGFSWHIYRGVWNDVESELQD